MSKRKKQIEEFFNQYESHFNNAMTGASDVQTSFTQSFADCFVESSPNGVISGKNDKQFADKLKQGFDFYKSIGSKAMNIINKDISMLDDFHAIAKIYWRYTYIKDDQEGSIDFNTIYILNTISEPKIFAYIAGDEQKALRDRNLVPEEEEISH